MWGLEKITNDDISPLIKTFSGYSDTDILKKLLMRVNQQTIISCAKKNSL